MMMRTIRPVLLMASPNSLMRLMMGAWLGSCYLQDEYDDQDDDHDDSSDTDTHDSLLP